MKNSILIERMKLNKKYDKLRKMEEKLDKEFEKLNQKCEHEILVTSVESKSKVFKGLTERPMTFCLFCREYIAPRKYVPEDLQKKVEKAVSINMKDFPKLANKWGNKYYSNIRDIYMTFEGEESEYEKGNRIKKIMEDMEKSLND